MVDFAWPDTAQVIHPLTQAEVAAGFPESATPALIVAALPAGAKAGDLVHHTTPEGVLVKYELYGSAGGLVADRQSSEIQDYAAEPLETDFAPSAKITVTDGAGLITAYTNNLAGNAWVEGDYEGASGGGTGDVETAYDAWLVANPGQSVAQYIASQAAGGAVDWIRDSFVATVGQAVYNLSQAPLDPDSVEFSVSGAPNFVHTTDYTVAGSVVTVQAAMAALIQAGDAVEITYL